MNKRSNNFLKKQNKIDLIPILIELWSYISRKRKKQLIIVLITMILAAISELISLAAVIPFLKIISNPELGIKEIDIFNFLNILKIDSPKQIIIGVTILFSIAIICSALIRLLNLWLQLRVCASISSDLSCLAYKKTLYQQYEYHLKTNTSSILNASTTQMQEVNILINSCLVFITSTFISLALYLGLLLINFKIAIYSALIFIFSYYFVAFRLKEILSMNSFIAANFGQEQIKSMQEGLGAIKDIILAGNQNLYLRKYKSADFPMRIKLSESSFFSKFPRYCFEAIGMLLIASLALSYSNDSSKSGEVIILLGSFALAAQRLLPAIQQIYSSWALIKSSSSALEKVLEILRLKFTFANFKDSKNKNKNKFKSSIILKNITFRYAIGENKIINNINLEVKMGDKIGLVGKTGSGKSTLIDIIIGLLKPTEGYILIDGKNLYDDDNKKSKNLLNNWRSNIAYVPQTIYLSDLSIMENIAFGIEKDLIDLDLVKSSAEISQISSFIESLPEKYNTYIGERGVRLSGGQRQRLGIARAIYKNSKILVLDEATSALDNETESIIMKSLGTYNNEMTVFMIAHRLSTLQDCDKVYELSSGKIKLKDI